MTSAPDCQWLRGALHGAELGAIDRIADTAGRPGARLDWTDPAVARALAPVTALIDAAALPGARLVRTVGFTKDVANNWGVPWHQDRIIAVTDRHDAPGFGNWSCKAGQWHCEPPLAIFDMMRFVRLHLDDCDTENGAMQIALGSQTAGPVTAAEAATLADALPQETCTARRGDVQILPMLVLHRSPPARSTAPRRALRLDYATIDLPHPLQWVTA